MRILLVNPFGHRIGGIEVHLQHLLPALEAAGHEVGLLHQHPVPPGAQGIAAPGTPRWCPATEGTGNAWESIRRWQPDAVYAHQLLEPSLMRRLQAAWPSLYFAHCYLGVCVSMTRSWRWPQPRTCDRLLGWGCLLHYFPHRCGGLNPRVMWRLFQEQREARLVIQRFQRLITHSEHVRQVYVRHGFPAPQANKIPFWVPTPATAPRRERPPPADGPVRILFLGRFDSGKGGALLLEALPEFSRRVGRPVDVTLAGEGPELARWRRAAGRVAARERAVTVRFPGWLDAAARDAALETAHVLAMPSVWPEPFGMGGIEAGAWGVPAVAFDVGGIGEWLQEGVNGALAPGNPPSAAGLAEALVRVVADPGHYRILSRGALAATQRFEASAHLAAVEENLAGCLREWRPLPA